MIKLLKTHRLDMSGLFRREFLRSPEGMEGTEGTEGTAESPNSPLLFSDERRVGSQKKFFTAWPCSRQTRQTCVPSRDIRDIRDIITVRTDHNNCVVASQNLHRMMSLDDS